MRQPKAADVRYYVDADVLGLAKILVQLRPDITYPGDPGGTMHRRVRPPCVTTSPTILDTEWIPEVARHGWLVITRDANIAAHRAEIRAVRDSGTRMVVLAGPEANTTWAQLEIVMSRWRDIEGLCEQPGPFIYAARRTRLSRVPLD